MLWRWDKNNIIYNQTSRTSSRFSLKRNNTVYYTYGSPSFSSTTGTWTGFNQSTPSYPQVDLNDSAWVTIIPPPTNEVYYGSDLHVTNGGQIWTYDGVVVKYNSVLGKGSFVEYVYSLQSNTYPINGQEGSYWYLNRKVS